MSDQLAVVLRHQRYLRLFALVPQALHQLRFVRAAESPQMHREHLRVILSPFRTDEYAVVPHMNHEP